MLQSQAGVFPAGSGLLHRPQQVIPGRERVVALRVKGSPGRGWLVAGLRDACAGWERLVAGDVAWKRLQVFAVCCG
ncbi:hypothetical protein GCM10028786_29870 [Flaviaesturariibacter terrae]